MGFRHIILAGVLCIAPLCLRSSALADAPSAHSLHGEAFDDGPRQHARLLEGMGEIRFPVTAKDPLAGRFVEQGLAQVHTFYYFEAERSFRQAAFHDPSCAMAYWGMALANQNNAKRGAAFIRKAEEAAEKAPVTDRERKYIDAVKASVAEGRSDKERREGYVKGLEAIVLSDPDDIEAKALLAWGIISLSWSGERISSRVAVNVLLDEVLRKSPLHPGAHHYRIHLWDGSDPVQASLSAEAYARAAPGIAHAWHMPGHIYNGLARWKDAAYQQEGSARVDHAQLIASMTMPFEIHNYVHNQHYLIAQLLHLGRARDAIDFARNLIELPRDPKRNTKDDGGSAQRLGRLCLMKTCVRFELWRELLADRSLDWSDLPQEKAWRAYSRGLAHLGLGERDGALAEAGELDRIAAEAAKNKGWDADLIETARLELRGRLLVAEGKQLEGFDLLDRGARMQVEKFDGDLGPYPHPLRESLGFAHLEAQNWGLAEACFRDVLSRRKDTVVSCAGLSEALARRGRPDEAREARERIAAAADPDPELPLLRRMAGVPGLAGSRDDRGTLTSTPSEHRVPLEPLGPRLWTPPPAPELELVDAAGSEVRLSTLRGRPVVIIFHLGLSCPHCLEQLRAFGKLAKGFEEARAEVLAASDDPPRALGDFAASSEGAKIPLRLLADPGRKGARTYRVHDEFEDLPLHGVVLVDSEGKIRWARASAEPFTDAPFVLEELKRTEAIISRDRKARI
jgi:peroxiredoxin